MKSRKNHNGTSWGYRIIRSLETSPSGETIEWFQIHRVYYDEYKISSWGKEPVVPGGESVGELTGDLQYMLEAIKHPVLNAEDMPK